MSVPKVKKKYSDILIIAFLLIAARAYGNAPIIDYEWPFHPKSSQYGMVVSEESIASQAGAEILSQGGNAVDSAVAVGFALAVTLPKAGNLGGGGFMLIHLEKSKKNIALDYRETAPAGAAKEMYLNHDGTIQRDNIRNTAKGAGIPGTVAGLLHAHQKYGRLTLAKVLMPAITLAREGFPVSWTLADSIRSRKKRLQSCEVTRQVLFKKNGENYQPGEIMKRPDLARTLSIIANQGKRGFYRGELAKRLVRGIAEHGGIISLEDLKNYQVKEREVLSGEYRGFEVVTMPPPSSGGVHLIQMLNMLENYPLSEWGPNRAKTIQIMVETMRSAYADRSKYLGDPDFFDVPVARLTSKAYAKKLVQQISLSKARKSSEIQPGSLLPYESPQTTQFSVVDSEGNMVSNTYTLNFSYGNGHMVAGTGVLLNNEMDDFSVKPGVPNAYGLIGGEANSIKPGKRPLSSMTPAFIFKEGKPFLVTGSPGGSAIITVVLETIVNMLDFGMNIAAATAWPRFHHQWFPDVVYLESGISADTGDKLIEMGYKIKKRRTLGGTQSIAITGKSQFGATDPRRPGGAAIAARKILIQKN